MTPLLPLEDGVSPFSFGLRRKLNLKSDEARNQSLTPETLAQGSVPFP